MDCGNIKAPGLRCRLGSETLSQLAFPWESNLNFPVENSHWDNAVLKKWSGMNQEGKFPGCKPSMQNYSLTYIRFSGGSLWPLLIYSSQFCSAPWLIGSSGGHNGWFSRDPHPAFSAGGPCEQLLHGQECPLLMLSIQHFLYRLWRSPPSKVPRRMAWKGHILSGEGGWGTFCIPRTPPPPLGSEYVCPHELHVCDCELSSRQRTVRLI